jgi:hypothetical protein
MSLMKSRYSVRVPNSLHIDVHDWRLEQRDAQPEAQAHWLEPMA